MKTRFRPEVSALLEVGVMFLPAVPAYLWMWPNLSGNANDIVQNVVYLYVLAGTLFIGLRRWPADALGLNLRGLGLAAACGALILLGRFLIIQAIDFGVSPVPHSLFSVLSDALFFTFLVGLAEELLFRGLIYRALVSWLGAGWAILGSSVGFVLWHIFGQGPLIGFAALLIGMLFGLIRWRAGGILGLIMLHALWDLETVYAASLSSNADLNLGRVQILSLPLIYVGMILLVLPPLYLWLLHPWVVRRLRREQLAPP